MMMMMTVPLTTDRTMEVRQRDLIGFILIFWANLEGVIGASLFWLELSESLAHRLGHGL